MSDYGLVVTQTGPASALTTYTPDNAAFSYTDYAGTLSATSVRARFTRPNIGIQSQYTASPCARVRFNTNAPFVRINLNFTALDTNTALNDYTEVFVDGVAATHCNSPAAFGVPATQSVILALDGTSHLVEILLPYGASCDFVSVDVPTGSTISAPAARPATILLVGGDSIPQSYYATRASLSWAYLLAQAKNYQLMNMGYGGRQCTASDGTVMAGLTTVGVPTVAGYMIGYNDFAAQTALATFAAAYASFLTNFRALLPGIKLYCISPIYSTNTNTLTLQNYRDQIQTVVAASGNALNIFVDGLTLMTNNSNRLQDGIHPNDLGASEIATALAAIVSA